ncbi:MAG: hypothetical protein AB7O26_01865, partial [Planctomycetaceae bacterium]
MANPLSVRCAGCGTMLKLTAKTVGKRIACPLCQQQFVVQDPTVLGAVAAIKKSSPQPSRNSTSPKPAEKKAASQTSAAKASAQVGNPKVAAKPAAAAPIQPSRPAADEHEVAAYADFEEFGDDIEIVDDFDEDEFAQMQQPQAKGKTPRGSRPDEEPLPGRKPPERKARPVKIDNSDIVRNSKRLLILGVVAVVIAVAAGVVMFSINTFKAVAAKANELEARMDLAWLPKYPIAVLNVRVAEVWKTPFWQQVAADEEVVHNLGLMREKLGFGPEDNERFAFCEGSPPELMGHKLTKAMQFAKQAASMGTQGNTQQSV